VPQRAAQVNLRREIKLLIVVDRRNTVDDVHILEVLLQLLLQVLLLVAASVEQQRLLDDGRLVLRQYEQLLSGCQALILREPGMHCDPDLRQPPQA